MHVAKRILRYKMKEILVLTEENDIKIKKEHENLEIKHLTKWIFNKGRSEQAPLG